MEGLVADEPRESGGELIGGGGGGCGENGMKIGLDAGLERDSGKRTKGKRIPAFRLFLFFFSRTSNITLGTPLACRDASVAASLATAGGGATALGGGRPGASDSFTTAERRGAPASEAC